MPDPALENLVRIGQLKVEPRKDAEWSAASWRVPGAAHQKRNLAEYEGYLDVEESVVVEMSELTAMFLADVEALIGHGGNGQ